VGRPQLHDLVADHIRSERSGDVWLLLPVQCSNLYREVGENYNLWIRPAQ
jgi:hypothetical protein